MTHQMKKYSVNIVLVVGSDYSPGHQCEVEAVTRLRYLPSRRSVWEGRCCGKAVLLKVYDAHTKQQRDVNAEWQQANRLYSAGLGVATPLFLASTDAGEILVVYEFIENGQILGKYILDADAEGRENAFRQLIRIHAMQHEHGCYQSDDHLGNYLWSNGKLWILDAGSFVFSKAPLNTAARVDNMSCLSANIPLTFRSLYDEILVNEYSHELPMIDQLIPVKIRRRVLHYYKKTRRACSDFECFNSSGKKWIACSAIDSQLRQMLLSDPDQFFGHGADMVKDGRTCSVVDVEVNGKSYILKRYNQKSLIYRMTHCFITPRALVSWSNGHILKLFGVATPKPIACLLLKSGLLLSKGYLVMEKITGKPLDQLSHDVIKDSCNSIPSQFVSLCDQLDAMKAVHGDMKASNFIFDDTGVLQLIDLDSLVFHRSMNYYNQEQAKDLSRFMRNWANFPELVKLFRDRIELIGE